MYFQFCMEISFLPRLLTLSVLMYVGKRQDWDQKTNLDAIYVQMLCIVQLPNEEGDMHII